MSKGVISTGIKCPIIKEGDDLKKIVIDSLAGNIILQDGDVIGITESVVARSQGNYVTLNEIADQIKAMNKNNLPIRVINPIYSRNRFAMILKAIARSTNKIELIMPQFDMVGNVIRCHPYTGINYDNYYRSICENEGCEVTITDNIYYRDIPGFFNIDCSLRPDFSRNIMDNYITLKDICHDKTEYGLLGSNKATEEKLKLFPNTAKAYDLVYNIKSFVKKAFGVNVEVMIYGDGCFKDPDYEIWEFADPVVSPAYTYGLKGSPNEIKIKAFADDKYKDLNGDDLDAAIKNEIAQKDKHLIGKMDAQGTTPRSYVALLGSLMDLTSGSGDKGTPIVVVQNYFKNYSNA